MYIIIRKDLLIFLRRSKAELCPIGSFVSLGECGELVATQVKMPQNKRLTKQTWASQLEAKDMSAP